MNAKELINHASELPLEERARMVDSLLKSLNRLHEDVDRAWADVAHRRLTELREGRVEAIPGEAVFAKLKKRFEK